jgi:hypothetical protein
MSVDRQPHRLHHHVSVVVFLVLTLVAAAACVSTPQPKTGRSPAWSPARPGALAAFLEHYDAVRNDANQGRDGQLVSSVESGPLLRASQADFRIAKRLDPQDKNPGPDVTHGKPQTYLPAFKGYPVWFVAASDIVPDGGRAVDLVVRSSAGSLWKKAQSVALDEGAELPTIAVRDGSPVAVTGQSVGLARQPAEAATAYAALLERGRDAPQAAAFEAHPDTERAHRASQANRGQASSFSYDQTFEVTSVRALATEDGGALVLFTMAESEALTMRNTSLRFSEDDAVAAYTGVNRGEAFLRTTWVWQVVAAVPPKNPENNKVRLLGTQRSLASAEMK